MLALILEGVRAGAAPAIDHAVVIMNRDTESRRQLAKETAALGLGPVLVSNPLDAIQWLQDTGSKVDAVIASERILDLSEFLSFLHETHPSIRRVISVEQGASPILLEQEMPAHVDAIVSLPVQRDTLRKALSPGPRGGSS